jgi:CBS domain-containing protein
MPYLSGLIGQTVKDAQNQPIGKLTDVIVDANQSYPFISAIAYRTKRSKEVQFVAWNQMAELEPGQVRLKIEAAQLAPTTKTQYATTDGVADSGTTTSQPLSINTTALAYEENGRGLPLAKRILDKQIIDINGRRLVRVNDLQLLRVNGHYRLIGADISATGLLRRLGLGGVSEAVAHILGKTLEGRYIAWDAVDPLEHGTAALQLKTRYDKISKMHPADIADIVRQLGKQVGASIFENLDTEVAADTLQEFDAEMQISVLEQLDDQRAADIIEAMEPDDAADLLAEMDEERADTLLSMIDEEDAAEVRSLLAYPEDSAGGVMTTEYIAVPATLTAQETINRLRELAPEAETIYYIYVVDEEEHLLGVISLRDLIVAQPDTRVSDFMHSGAVSIEADADREEVTLLLAKYSLLAVPVVDAEKKLLGIVTVDDALAQLLPALWHRPRAMA